jgi:hypothetical protein
MRPARGPLPPLARLLAGRGQRPGLTCRWAPGRPHRRAQAVPVPHWQPEAQGRRALSLWELLIRPC